MKTDSYMRQLEQCAMNEAKSTDKDDFMAFGPNYFGCGWKNESYYNFNFSVAITLIGRIYGDKKLKNSDYHKGVEYIAREVGLPKRQVKILRKKLRYKNGYWFKTPYSIVEIVERIIEKLHESKNETYVSCFLSKNKKKLYREILIEEQYIAIQEAQRGGRKKVVDISDDLRNLTIKV